MSKWLVPGVSVVVTFDPYTQISNTAAAKYNGTVQRIRSRKSYGTHGYMYTLERAESEKGMPYWFTEHELQPLEV